ncbi:CBS domain-containing protein [Methanobrevibacter filiformis]
MVRDVFTVKTETQIIDVLKTFRVNRITGLPVINLNSKVRMRHQRFL